MSRWGIGLSEKMKACKEAEPFTDILEGDGGVPEKDPPSSSKTGFKVTTMKIIVWVCILNGLAWVWCSYILARTGADRRGLVTGRAQGDHRRGADLRSQGAV